MLCLFDFQFGVCAYCASHVGTESVGMLCTLDARALQGVPAPTVRVVGQTFAVHGSQSITKPQPLYAVLVTTVSTTGAATEAAAPRVVGCADAAYQPLLLH